MEKNDFFSDFKNHRFRLYLKLLFLLRNFVSFLFGGETCLCCSKHTLGLPLCKNCLSLLFPEENAPSCSVCGKKLVSEIGICFQCRNERTLKSVDRAFSIHGYQLWKKSLLTAWKIYDKRTLSPYFAVIFHKKLLEVEKFYGQTLPIVPVPPRKDKIRERGWDQIEELCFYLKEVWGVEVLPMLERLSRTQQKKLDRTQRIERISSSYALKSKEWLKKHKIQPPKAVILADDVLTTGSTLEACARELKKIGVEKVFALTLFTVD